MKLGEDKYYGVLTVFFVLALMPLVMRVVPVHLDPAMAALSGELVTTDSFYYFKGIILIIGAVGIFLSILFNRMIGTTKFGFDRIQKLILVMAVLILVASVASPYRTSAFSGFRDHFEGFYVWMAYLMLFLCAYLNPKITEKLKTVMLPIAVSVSAVSLIGILQSFGINMMNMSWFKYLVLPSKYWSLDQDVFIQPLSAYSFLGNSNYVGTYAALMIPLLILGLVSEKSWKRGVVGGSIALCSGFLAASHSEAGYVAYTGIVGGLLLLGVLKKKKSVIIGLLCSFVSFVSILSAGNFSGGSIPVYGYLFLIPITGGIYYLVLNSEIGRKTKAATLVGILLVMGMGIFVMKDYESEGWIRSERYTAIHVDNSSATLEVQTKSGETNVYSIEHIENEYTITALGEIHTLTESDLKSGMHIEWKDSEFAVDGSLTSSGFRVFELLPTHLRFIYNGKTFSAVTGSGQMAIQRDSSQYNHFFKDETLGSGRTFIWNRGVSLVRENLLIGSGPDTFPFRFPQEDLIGKLNSSGKANLMVDKPHNFYLQTITNLGLPFLIMVAYLFLNPCCANTGQKGDITDRYLLGMSVLGFFLAGFFNDSTIPTAMIFWFLLGAFNREAQSS